MLMQTGDHSRISAITDLSASFILHPWQMLLLIIAAWMNRQQQDAIEYLRTENAMLKEKLGKKRILLNDDQRQRLAVKGKVLERNLKAFFGSSRQLRSITAPDAADFRRWLKDSEQLHENTIRRRCGRSRQFFREALKRKLIDENPFDGMPVAVQSNKAKEHFVTLEDTSKVVAACPNAEWRLIVSLCRFGGVRCPS
ncbi:MAG: phage integrase SAM-like domain-containing protein, partial [Planctomycetaceae bacterium]